MVKSRNSFSSITASGAVGPIREDFADPISIELKGSGRHLPLPGSSRHSADLDARARNSQQQVHAEETGMITVIIPSACQLERKASLKRAILSAQKQLPPPTIIVVVNGSRYDHEMYDELRRWPGVKCAYVPQANQAAAQKVGRSMVTTRYFSYLDDDDEFLDGAFEKRLIRAEKGDLPDVIVSGGVLVVDGVERSNMPMDSDASSELQLSLLGQNWFASCATLFRTRSVSVDFFDGETVWLEWTLLAFKLLHAGKRFAAVSEIAYKVNQSPVSLSRDPSRVLIEPAALNLLLKFALTNEARSRIRTRLEEAYHGCSEFELRRGNLAEAWKYHLKSMASFRGLRFATFTRYLFWAMFRRR